MSLVRPAPPPITFAEDESFDVGQDTRTGVALLKYRYDVPFAFTGTINKLTFHLEPHEVPVDDSKQLPAVVEKDVGTED